MSAKFRCPHCSREMLVVPAATGQQDHPRTGNQPRQLMTDARAADFEMPFGKHQGRTLAQIDEKDPEYLDWARNQFDRAVGRAIQHYVDHCRPQQSRR